MDVRWTIFITSVFLASVQGYANASVDFIGNNNFDPVWEVANDIYIPDSVVINVDDIKILNSVNIVNYGLVYGNVNVCPGCDVYIKNAGYVGANFSVPDDARVIQKIDDVTDINSINVDGNFQVWVQGVDKISLDGLMDVSANADKIVLTDAGVALGAGDMGVLNSPDAPEIELRGKISLYLDEINPDGMVLSNVYGDGAIQVVAENLDPMYRLVPRLTGNSLYIDVVRDEDYSKVFDDSTGSILDDLRQENPDDELLGALDSAQNADEINSVIARSGRLNPINLMRSVRLFNSFEMSRQGLDSTGIGIAPMFMFSDDFNLFGATIDGAYALSNNFKMYASVYAAGMNFDDGLDVYESALYGGNVHIAYNYDVLFARAIGGITIADFDIGSVFDGNKFVSDPSGLALYGAADLGINLNVIDALVVSPFVRVGFDYAKILDVYDSDFITGAGLDAMFNVDGYDIKYRYGLGLGVDTRGWFNATLRMDILSATDGFGGNVNVGLVGDDDGNIGYVARVGAKMSF